MRDDDRGDGGEAAEKVQAGDAVLFGPGGDDFDGRGDESKMGEEVGDGLLDEEEVEDRSDSSWLMSWGKIWRSPGLKDMSLRPSVISC